MAKKKKKATRDVDQLLALYRQMVLFRKFEEKVGLAYTKGKFSGFCHLHIGQEGLAVGVQSCLQPDDYMIGSYRSHTQAIGKGIDPKNVLAELFAKEAGVCRGKGGSMHMFSSEHRFLGGHGIVGGQVPLAAGVGFAIKYRGDDSICVCYLGDAAANQGQFFEALNMAATWDLPVLFIIENNKYGMGTDISRTTSVSKLSERALGFAMDHSIVNGMNVLEVIDHTQTVVDEVRKSARPHLLEAETYRYRGHSVSDPGTYRTKDEVKEYQQHHDPIKQLAQFLLEEELAAEEQLKDLEASVKAELKDAEAYADQAEAPSVSEAFEHVLV